MSYLKGSNIKHQPQLGMPQYAETEQRIAQRPDILRKFTEEATYMPKSAREWALKPLALGLKGAGGLFQRGEAGLANLAMGLQERKPSPTTPSTLMKMDFGEAMKSTWRDIQDIVSPLKQAWRGISGERLGELGDPIHRVLPEMRDPITGYDWSEPIAAIGGLSATMGLANFLTKGKLVEGALRKMPAKMSDEWVGSTTKLMREGSDDAVKWVRSQYSNWHNQYGSIAMDKYKSGVNGLLAKLAQHPNAKEQAIIRQISNALVEGGGAVPKKGFEITIKNVNTIKNVIGKYINWKSNIPYQQYLQGLWKWLKGGIKDTLKKNPKALSQLDKLDDAAKEIYPMSQWVERVTKGITAKYPKTGAMKAVFFSSGKAGERLSLKSFSKYSTKIKQAIKNFYKYRGRVGMKKTVGGSARRYLPWAVGYGVFRKGMRGLEGGGGGSSTYPSGGGG